MTKELRSHTGLAVISRFTTKPAGKGTGLGLATVYGIVKQSGGFLRVSSELGQGTTFDIYFPRAATAEAEPTRTPPPSTFRGTETVLVVEDDPRVRAVALRSLQGAGYRVLLAGDAEEALGIAERRQERLDLLITDMVMPGPSGHLVAEALRAIHGGLRVLYVSGYGPVAVSEEQGAAFLAKPFTPSSLLERVRAVLDAP